MASHAATPALAPLILRLALAITFIWAGAGKLMGSTIYSAEDAAALRAMNVNPLAATDESTGVETFTAKPLHSISLAIHAAANPATTADAAAPRAIWPAWAATGNLPVLFAIGGAITELIVGFFLLLGLLTRLSGLTIAGVMLVAMWLTQIGPAVQSGNTFLGFIPVGPGHSPWFAPASYQLLLWQFALLAMGLALFFTGGGRIALDAAARNRHRDEFDEDDADDEDDE